jgi:hypothetical protein
VIVESYLYDGTNALDVCMWVGADAYINDADELVIRTLEGDHVAATGDHVMRGVEGEHYPIKPSIYAATYELVGERS